jgi:hypothetical protein
MAEKRLTKEKRELLIERSRAQARLIVEADIQPGKMLPLDYLLMVINDPNADSDRKDRLAIAAAPYCHPRLVERHTVGKKDQRSEDAEMAGVGTPWSSDLEFENRAQ